MRNVPEIESFYVIINGVCEVSYLTRQNVSRTAHCFFVLRINSTVNCLYRFIQISVPRRTTSMINTNMTLHDDTRSPAASSSSPAGPYFRCYWGDILRIDALTPGGILSFLNCFLLTPKHTHIITHKYTATRDLSRIRSHTLLRFRYYFSEPLSRGGMSTSL